MSIGLPVFVYSQALGTFYGSISLTDLGVTTPLDLAGVYLAFVAETGVPAAIDYYRFSTDRWKSISRGYRPEPTTGD